MTWTSSHSSRPLNTGKERKEGEKKKRIKSEKEFIELNEKKKVATVRQDYCTCEGRVVHRWCRLWGRHYNQMESLPMKRKSWLKTLYSRWGDWGRMLCLYTSCRSHQMKPTKRQLLLIPVDTFFFFLSMLTALCTIECYNRIQNFNRVRNPSKLSYTRLHLTNYSLDKTE